MCIKRAIILIIGSFERYHKKNCIKVRHLIFINCTKEYRENLDIQLCVILSLISRDNFILAICHTELQNEKLKIF